MGKILTISIAAYNVEQYIGQALDSLIDERIIDDLEIFVVDDGGTDKTLDIAKRYAEKYPNSIFPIHKENGGYGSTINTSVRLATGKYFKQLDGDDWFDKEGLYDLVMYLKNTDTDVICTTKYEGTCVDDLKVITRFNIEKNKEFNIPEISNYDLCIGMWELTYKTNILLQSELVLLEKVLYTDQYYSTIPFSKAKTIVFLDKTVYCYRLGRDGQSISVESRKKHFDNGLIVAKGLCSFCAAQKLLKNENYAYILNRVKRYTIWSLRNILLLGINQETKRVLMRFENEIKEISPDVFALELSCRKKQPKFVFMMKILRTSKYKLFILLKLYPNNF